MKNFHLLRAILRGAWLIEPNYAQASLPIVARILKGESPFIQGRHNALEEDSPSKEPKKPEFAVAYFCSISGTFKAAKYSSFNEAPPGSIAIHELSGPLLKADDCGIPGTESQGNIISEADASPNIVAHIIKTDSPGGQVDGTSTYSDKVKGTKKPVIGFVNGLACSAAYWAIAGADEIIASELTNTIGSIGVYSSLKDYSGWYEQMGIKSLDVYAPQSTEKNKPYKDAFKGDTTALEEDLSHTADVFINSVKDLRKSKLNKKAGDPFKGAAYNASRAKDIGLIDEIGNFDYALQRARDLASKSNQSLQPNSNNQGTMKLKLLAAWGALLGVFGTSVSAGSSHVEFDASEEHLSKLNDELKAGSEAKSALEAAVSAKQTAEVSLATANQSISEKDIEIRTLKEVIGNYGNKPGASSSNPKKEETDNVGGGETKSIADPESDHMKTAKSMGLL
jgi:ClpP class serine protease